MNLEKHLCTFLRMQMKLLPRFFISFHRHQVSTAYIFIQIADANFNAKDKNGETVLDAMQTDCQHNFEPTDNIIYMLQRGANCNIQNNAGW